MNTTVKASLILVALVLLLSIVVYASGLHKDFMTSQYVFLIGAIALNVGVVYWALDRDASIKGYGAQLFTALGIGVLAGFIIVIASWGLASVVFPDSIDEMKQGAIEYMDEQRAGASYESVEEEELAQERYDRQLETLEKTTPLSQAIPGGIGTLFTSVVSGAVIAAFKRRKGVA